MSYLIVQYHTALAPGTELPDEKGVLRYRLIFRNGAEPGNRWFIKVIVPYSKKSCL
jgi:hypothetical protein